MMELGELRTRERDKERRHVARLMRELETSRKRAATAEANLRAKVGIDLPLIKTALEHASFALDGVMADDDEDEGENGGSATCQHAKRTVDRALKSIATLGRKP